MIPSARSSLLQIVDTMENMKATQEMATAMKDTVKELKAAQKQFNIADFEDVYDDMDDLMMDQEEIQDIMSRQLGSVRRPGPHHPVAAHSNRDRIAPPPPSPSAPPLHRGVKGYDA